MTEIFNYGDNATVLVEQLLEKTDGPLNMFVQAKKFEKILFQSQIFVILEQDLQTYKFIETRVLT